MTYPDSRNSLRATPAELEQIRTIVLFVWGLYGLGLVVAGLPTIVGIVLAYVKRDSAIGTIYESHFNYAISTFWISILIAVIGAVATLIFIGWLVLFLGGIWYIYRIVKGALRALNREPVF